MGTSDRIELFILQLLEDESNWIELKRNELAGIFSCSPSQINYVLSTRFNEKNGYVIESRRGGGGYLRIKRLEINDHDLISSCIEAIGDNLDAVACDAILKALKQDRLLDEYVYKIVQTATSDRSISVNQPYKNMVRATILKNILLRIKEEKSYV